MNRSAEGIDSHVRIGACIVDLVVFYIENIFCRMRGEVCSRSPALLFILKITYMNTKGITQEDKSRAMRYFIKQFLPGGDWSGYHNIFVCPRSMDEMMMYWNAGVHDLMFCMEVSSQKQFDAIEASPVPWDHIIASSRTSMDPMLKKLYKKLHDKGVMIIVSVTQSDDKIGNERNQRTAYLRTLIDQPDLIETDYPARWIGLPTDRKTLKKLRK